MHALRSWAEHILYHFFLCIAYRTAATCPKISHAVTTVIAALNILIYDFFHTLFCVTFLKDNLRFGIITTQMLKLLPTFKRVIITPHFCPRLKGSSPVSIRRSPIEPNATFGITRG